MATKKLSSIVNKQIVKMGLAALRRNRVYQGCLRFLASLREDQRAVFEKLIRGQLDSYAENSVLTWIAAGSYLIANYLWNERRN